MKLFNPKESPELDRLRKENEELKNRLHKILADTNESSELENKISAMTEQLSDMAKEEQRIEDFIKNATDEKVKKSKSVFELNKQIGELAQEKEQLEESINSFENSNSSLEEKQESNKINLSKLTSSIKEKENELSELANKFVTLNGTATRLVEEIKLEETRLGGLKETSSDLTTQIKNDKKKVLGLEKKIEIKGKLKAKTEIEAEAIEQSFKVLDEKKTNRLQEVSDLKTKIEKTKEEHALIAGQLKNDEELRNSMQTKNAELILELSGKENVFNKFTKEKEKFTNEISAKRNVLDSVNFEIINKNEIISQLEKEIEIFSKQKKETELSIKKKESTADEFKQILIKKRDDESRLEEHLNELKNNITEFEEKKFKVEENILQLDSSFAEITKKLTEEINESKSKLIYLKQLIIEKDRDFNNKEKTFLKRNTQLAEYTGMVRLLRKEKDLLEKQLSDLKNSKETLSNNIISLKEKESEGKTKVNQYDIEIEDLITKRESISSELNSLLDSSYKNYNEYNERNGLLIDEIHNHENILTTLAGKESGLELTLSKLNEDISKAELEKEELSTNISQLITMEKSFKEKVETYKKELERIEEETFLDTQGLDINVEVQKIKNGKSKLESNN